MQTRILTVAMVVIAISAVVGMSAYTTGNVTRSSNVNVVSDDVGLIGLEDGTSGDLVQQNASGALTVDFSRAGGTGVNTAAHFELGNPSDANNQSAFNITNNGGTARDLTIAYNNAGGTSDADANIQFQVYDGTGTQVATVSEESTSATITGVASGTTHYVVIVVDTNGLDSTADLSGTLKVSA